MLALWREKAHWFFRGPQGRSPLNSAQSENPTEVGFFLTHACAFPVVTCSWDSFTEVTALWRGWGRINKKVYVLTTFHGIHPGTAEPHTLAMPKGDNAGCTWHCAPQFWLLIPTITLCPRIIIPEGWVASGTVLAPGLSNLGTGDDLTLRIGVGRLWQFCYPRSCRRNRQIKCSMAGQGVVVTTPWISIRPPQRWPHILEPHFAWWRGSKQREAGIGACPAEMAPLGRQTVEEVAAHMDC